MSHKPLGAGDLPVGRSFDCHFGPFVPRLTFLSESRLELDIPGQEVRTREIVTIDGASIRPGIAMMSWVEANGTVVFHVQDYERMTVSSHARLPDGAMVRSTGTIRWVEG